jgi:hypothetical protein
VMAAGRAGLHDFAVRAGHAARRGGRRTAWIQERCRAFAGSFPMASVTAFARCLRSALGGSYRPGSSPAQSRFCSERGRAGARYRGGL